MSRRSKGIKRWIARTGRLLGIEADLIDDAGLAALADARGFDLLPRHYYSPVPQREDLAESGFWDEVSKLRGLEMREAEAIRFLETRLPPYLVEFRSCFPVENTAGTDGFCVINGVYMAVDAHVYYGMLRDLKPRRVIEVGSGQSTRVAVEAVRRNAAEGQPQAEILAIEPYPSSILRALAADRQITLLERRVQEVPITEFEALEAGDVLFIDSTHVLREGGDVQCEYLEILPSLKPGVHVHIHDISLPRRYPRVYNLQGIYWNEQYMLQAFLCFNRMFEVTWPGNYLLLRQPALMHKMFPEIAVMRQHYPLAEPSAFWIRRHSA